MLLALVVILMVTAPLAIKRLPLPLGSQPIDAPMPRTLGLSVLSTGELYLEGHAVSRAELASALSLEARMPKPAMLEIRSDADTPYAKVADALAVARGSGIEGIQIEGTRAK
ncbi:biopolymer transport protein ExbD/biopolymer transport protein TolR [Dokdonella fugitiva]|nr:biopolymer transport protein ExbD/biopolymer transport protein TolR [Dokdonella fugitiva]